MPEKTKPNKENDDAAKKNRRKPTIENQRGEEKNNLNKCQNESGYYYDDSYGYEIYNPDEDDDED